MPKKTTTRKTPSKPRVRVPEATVVKAIAKSRGIMSVVARALNCDWHTAKKLVDAYPAARQAFENERETLVDTAESGLVTLLGDTDSKVRLNACQFVLERIGKKRGYSQRQEIDHTTLGEKITQPRIIIGAQARGNEQ